MSSSLITLCILSNPAPPPLAPLLDIPYKGKGHAVMSAISEVPSNMSQSHAIAAFLCLKLYKQLEPGPDAAAVVMDAADSCDGSLIRAIRLLYDQYPILVG